MKKTILIALIFNSLLFNLSAQDIQKDKFELDIGRAFINKSSWMQPYRYEDKDMQALSVKITIKPTTSAREQFDLNDITLLDEDNKLRIRANAVYYYRGEKKIYLKSKAQNQNYNTFLDTVMKGYQNYEAKTYKTKFLRIGKRKDKAFVKALKKLNLQDEDVAYYLDFPVKENFSYGKVFYKNRPVGFAALKQ